MFIIEHKCWNKASVRSVVSEFGPKAEQACTESIRQNRSCVSFTAGNWRISRCLQVMSEKSYLQKNYISHNSLLWNYTHLKLILHYSATKCLPCSSVNTLNLFWPRALERTLYHHKYDFWTHEKDPAGLEGSISVYLVPNAISVRWLLNMNWGSKQHTELPIK